MAGPWEAYQRREPSTTIVDPNAPQLPYPPQGPWLEYGPPPQAPASAPSPQPGVPPIGFMGRVATGLGDPLHGGAQFLAHAVPSGVESAVNDAAAWMNRQPVIGPITRGLGMTPATTQDLDKRIALRESEYQSRRAAAGDTGMDWGRMAGNVATALPAAVALPAGSGMLGAAGVGAASNAALSMAEPVTTPGDYWAAKKEQGEMGAVTGAVGGAAGRLLGRMIAPNVAPAVRTLDEAGVSLTPGQITGGLARRVESGSTSVPIIGDAVRGMERRGIESFNRATANEVLAPLGRTVAEDVEVGRPLLSKVYSEISDQFNNTLARVRPFGPDQQFYADIQQIGQNFLTPESQGTFARILRDRVVSRMQGGALDGRTFKTIDTELGTSARLYGGSQVPADQELARSLRDVQMAMRGLVARTNPNEAPALDAANEAFARYVRMEGAAARTGATEGVFTPAQLGGAVRSADRSPRHAGYARGEALMQDLADAGRAVMPSTVPDSGTPFRAMLGLGGANVAGLLDPTTTVAGLGLLGAYTNPAQRTFQRFALTPRPLPLEVLGNTIANAPLAGAFAGGLLAP